MSSRVSRAARFRAVYRRLEQKIRGAIQKQNNTKNQQQTLKIIAHLSVAFTSALFAISSWHASMLPLAAERCRAVDWPLEQKIRGEIHKQNNTTNQQQTLKMNAHLSVAFTSALLLLFVYWLIRQAYTTYFIVLTMLLHIRTRIVISYI